MLSFQCVTQAASRAAWGAVSNSHSRRPTARAAQKHEADRYEVAQQLRTRPGLRLLSAAAATAAALAVGGAAALPAAAEALTPYQRGLALEYGLTSDGRIRSCPTDANPNCVSTSSTNTTFMPAWEAPQGSLADSMAQFEAALRGVAPEAQLVDTASGPSKEYRRWTVQDKLFDHDDVEVMITLQRAPYESEPPLVMFRSMAAQVKYIWPIQQPITDFGAQRQRLREVRQALGWRILGCDLLECFSEE